MAGSSQNFPNGGIERGYFRIALTLRINFSDTDIMGIISRERFSERLKSENPELSYEKIREKSEESAKKAPFKACLERKKRLLPAITNN